MISEESNQIEMLEGEEAENLMIEAEEVIAAIRDGEMEGEYFEF